MGTWNITLLLHGHMLHGHRGRSLKSFLELLVVFSSLLQYILGHHTALYIFVQLKQTEKYPILLSGLHLLLQVLAFAMVRTFFFQN